MAGSEFWCAVDTVKNAFYQTLQVVSRDKNNHLLYQHFYQYQTLGI